MDDTVTPAELHERVRAGESLTVLDVRGREAYDAWRIEGPALRSVYHPYVRFLAAESKDEVGELVADLDVAGPVIAVCARGETSAHAAEILRSAGIDAANLAGGMEAWADRYVGRDIDLDGGTLRQYERPATGCLGYLIASGGEAAVVDPLRAFADRYAADAADLGCELRYAVDTHVHADHVSAVREVIGRGGTGARLPAGARERGLAFEAGFVEGGDTLEVGALELGFRAAPGHTSELLVARVGDVLLSADCLFLDGVGRPDLEAGAAGAPELAGRLYDSVSELFELPEDTLVAPGHATPETEPAADATLTRPLAGVRERVALGEREAFVERVLGNAGERPANYQRIIDVNLGRESVDGFRELELGPNNCAVVSA
jgi:glyoxylase-like metal-dependent hydrolase (beta-lactamase superfamily II)